jgi:hypothetical protein
MVAKRTATPWRPAGREDASGAISSFKMEDEAIVAVNACIRCRNKR